MSAFNIRTLASVGVYEIREPNREIASVRCAGEHMTWEVNRATSKEVENEGKPRYIGFPTIWGPAPDGHLRIAPNPDGEYTLIVTMGWPRIPNSATDRRYLDGE